MAAVDVDQANWQHAEDGSVVYMDGEYGSPSKYETIVVDSQNGSEVNINEAPIVIFPNDPASLVGAEEVVMEETLEWNLPQSVEDEVVVGEEHSSDYRLDDDFPEIPLSSLSSVHPFPCDFCNRRFKKKANLMNHMVAHQTLRPHHCNVCSSRFMRKCDLVNHLKIHSYLPNRENRDSFTLEDLDSYEIPQYKASEASRRKRRISSGDGSSRRTLGRQTPPPKSPPSTPSPEKSTNYIEEDVRLLLEMTTKLQDGQQSDDDLCADTGSAELSQSRVTSGKPYECSTCKRCFARESALISHSQVHEEDVAYNCTKCSARFFSIKMLSDHLYKKHNINYSDEEEGPMSTKGYTGDERFGPYYCKICAISFHRLDEFKSHKKSLHSVREQEGLFSCSTCSSLFKTNDKLLIHLNVSSECQQHVCLLCGEHFTDQVLTQSHIRAKHGRDMPAHTCDYCGKRCQSSQALRQHLWFHQTDKRYSCKHPSCPKKFTTWDQLKRHMPTHDAPKFRVVDHSCGECSETFPDARSLQIHQRDHRPQFTGPGRRFNCNECGKSFGSRSSQQIHNRIHTGERPYGCRFCWKAFADGGTLRKHERIHTGEKPYVCAVCPRAFNQRVVLREHIRSHHSGLVNKLDRTEPVYQCPVCNVECENSDDLGAHIIKHCDANTLSNRVHSNAKKRARVNNYTVEAFEEPELPPINSETDSADSEKPVVELRRRRKASYSSFNHTLDAALSNINSMVETSPRKAKMINTKLMAGRGGKRGPKKKAKGRLVEVSSVVYPRPRTRTLSVRSSGRGDDLGAPEAKIANGRARTKNVNHLRGLQKGYEAATFPEIPEIKEEVNSDDDSLTWVEENSSDCEKVCLICRQSFTSKTDYLCHVQLHI